MPSTITDLTVHDLRFPTSRQLDGSDAMNPAPDYSAAYCILHTPGGGPAGHGMTFTIGRGNELCCQAIEALRPLIVGQSLEAIAADMGGFWRRITGDSQLRWVGPEKGVIHLATAAVVNAVWDLWAKVEGKPLWKLLADVSPEALVRCIDFRSLTDANRVMFKQYMQAGGMGVCQLDSCRIGVVNEVLAVILMAAKFGIPSARTPAGWACASTCSTSRSSTTCAPAAPTRGG